MILIFPLQPVSVMTYIVFFLKDTGSVIYPEYIYPTERGQYIHWIRQNVVEDFLHLCSWEIWFYTEEKFPSSVYEVFLWILTLCCSAHVHLVLLYTLKRLPFFFIMKCPWFSPTLFKIYLSMLEQHLDFWLIFTLFMFLHPITFNLCHSVCLKSSTHTHIYVSHHWRMLLINSANLF